MGVYQEFPRCLYKGPDQFRIVRDEAEKREALRDGWSLTVEPIAVPGEERAINWYPEASEPAVDAPVERGRWNATDERYDPIVPAADKAPAPAKRGRRPKAD